MDDFTRAGFLAHSLLPVYKRHIEQARGYITEALSQCDNPYIAFSGGKDSAAMLHLIAEQIPTVDAQILTGGESRLLHSDLDEILQWWRRETSINLIEVFVDRVFSTEWSSATFEEMYLQFQDEWNKYLHDKGHDAVFIGLRRKEASHRDLVFRRFGAIHRYSEKRKDSRAGTLLVLPVSNLTAVDVWAYLVSNEIPTFDAYESSNRTKTRLGKTAMGYGQLAELRMRDPAAFNAIVARFPELRRFGG